MEIDNILVIYLFIYLFILFILLLIVESSEEKVKIIGKFKTLCDVVQKSIVSHKI